MNSESKIIQNGIAHLIYNAKSAEDITHRFSPEGYELLNPEFSSYIDLLRPEIPQSTPVLLEVTGCSLGAQEQQSIERGVWSHYLLLMSASRDIAKRCKRKIFWFFICFLLSSILLFLVNSGTIEVLTNYAYIPFWFFGYRLLIFPILDYPPVLRDCKWYAQLASMNIVFTESPMGDVPLDLCEEMLEAKRSNFKEAKVSTDNNQAVRDLFWENGIVSIECWVKHLADVVRPSSVDGYELLSNEMADYLFQIEPFMKEDAQAQLSILGCDFNDSEKKSIVSALRNFYKLRIAETQALIKKNNIKIAVFSLCLVLATLVLYFWGSAVDVAYHEFIVLLFWFFADYLIEYVFLENLVLQHAKRKIESIANINVKF